MPIPPFLPPQLPWLFDVLVGQEWPQADEDACRRCAQAWTEALGALVALADGGNSAAKTVGYSVQAVSSDEFDRYWSKYTQGDQSAVGQMAQQCQALAEMLLQEAEQVEAAKLSIDIQIVILAIQLIGDIASAVVTAGASMAEGGAATLAARFTIKKLLFELLKGALLAAAPDFVTQTIMLAEGHQSSYDVGRTLMAAGTGALGAGVGMGVGAITGGLAASLSKRVVGDVADTVGKKVAGLAIDAGNAALTGALSNMATTALTDAATGQSLDNVWSAGLTGGAGGLLFHTAHEVGTSIGEHNRPAPVDFTTGDGKSLRGLRLKDGGFSLFDDKGIKHGTGTFDAESGRLSVKPVTGEPYQTSAKVVEPATGGAKHGEPAPSPNPEPNPNPNPSPNPEPSRSGPAPAPEATTHRDRQPGSPTPSGASLAAAGPPESRNPMLEAIQAAANAPAEHFASLGDRPVERSGFEPWPDPTPQIGKWSESDAAWQKVANDPERLGNGLSAEQIARSWQAGEKPPGVVTRKELVVGENTYIDGITDRGRKAFHVLARQELEQRHQSVKSVLDKLGVGEFRGEDHYRKFAESLDRKLNKIPGVSFEEFAKPGAGRDLARAKLNGLALEVNDALRYTMVFDEGDYARGAHETLKALQAAGCRLLDEQTMPDGTKVPGVRPLLEENGKLPQGAKFAKNFWRGGNRYLGINLTLVDAHGGPFELQFHTPRSFDVKQYLSHVPYEVYRFSEMSPERRVNAMLELVSMSDKYLSGHVPDGLESFAPTHKDNGLDKLFSDLRDEYGAEQDAADTPEKLYRADRKLWDLQDRHQAIRAANRELAENLNKLTQGDRTPEEIDRLFGHTVDLLRVREQVTGDPDQWRRLQYQAPVYEPSPHVVASEPHTGHTALGPQPGDLPAGHHPTLHLDDPIQLAPDHLVFPFRDEAGTLQWAHMQQAGDRWILHDGGPQSEELQAIGANLRTTPPGLDLIGHATPDGFLIGGRTVPFEDVLAHIPGAAEDTSPIRLIACEAGGAHGEAAQHLADFSGRKVIAADSTVWVSPDGHAVASNPVDRATNWYPKIPPDGVWHEFEPGSAPRRLADGDPRLPLAPKEVRSAADHKFAALGNDRNALPAKAGDSSAAYAKNPVEEPVNPDEKLPSEAHRELDHAVLANALENERENIHANRDFEQAANQKLAEAAEHFKLKDLAEAYKNHPGVDEGSARPLRPHILDEVRALTKEGLSELVKGRTAAKGDRIKSFVKIGDITIEQSVPLKNPRPSSVRIEGFPRQHHSYEDIAKDLGEFAIRLKAADIPDPDARIARALKRLLSEEPLTPEQRTQDLRKLAEIAAGQEFDAGKSSKGPLTADEFVQLGGSLAHLVGHLEPARDPRALLNLANLDIAARGGMTVADAVWFFNPVSQVGGARQALEAHIRINSDISRGEEPQDKAPADTIPELLRTWKDRAALRASNAASYFHDIEGVDDYWPAKQKMANGMKPPTPDEQKAKFIINLETARAQEQGPDKGRVDAFAREFFTVAEGEGWEHSPPPVALPEGVEWKRIPPRGSYTRTEVASRFDPIVLDEAFDAIPHMPMEEFKDLLKATKQNLDVDTRTREALVESFIERRKHPELVTRESVTAALSEPSRPWEVTSFAVQDPVETMKKMTRAQFQDLLRRAAVGAAVQQDAEVDLRMRNVLARYLEQEYVPYGGEREAPINPEALPPMADLLARVFASYQNVPSSLGTADTPVTDPGTADAS